MFFYDFHLIYKVFVNILEYANEVISYTTTRQKDMSNCIIDDIKACKDVSLMIVWG